MPRRVVEIVTCSFCAREGEDGFQAVRIQREGEPVDMLLDVCGFCAEGEQSAFALVVAAATPDPEKKKGRPSSTKGAPKVKPDLPVEKAFACKQKGCDKTFSKQQGLSMHLNRTHGIAAA